MSAKTKTNTEWTPSMLAVKSVYERQIRSFLCVIIEPAGSTCSIVTVDTMTVIFVKLVWHIPSTDIDDTDVSVLTRATELALFQKMMVSFIHLMPFGLSILLFLIPKYAFLTPKLNVHLDEMMVTNLFWFPEDFDIIGVGKRTYTHF